MRRRRRGRLGARPLASPAPRGSRLPPPFPPADPNTQILYACDSCGEKFLDAASLAQHVRIHTAQALVMFQADTDFYQQYGAAGAWHAEQVLPAAELLFRARDPPPETPAGEGQPPHE